MKRLIGPATVCALILLATNPTRGETIFEDNFDDGNAAGWDQYDGVFSIERGAYRIRSPSLQNDARAATGDPSWGDYRIECDLKPLNCGTAGLLFRIVDIGPGWGVGQYYELCFDSCSTVRICRVDGPSGAGTELAAAACSIEANAWHHLQLDVTAESASAALDGETVLTCDGLSEYPQGRFGLKTFRGGIALFDNVAVAAEPFPFALSEIIRNPLPSLRWDSAGPHCVYTVEIFVPEWNAWIPAPPVGQWPRRTLAWTDTSGILAASRGIYRVRAERSSEPLLAGMAASFDGRDDWIEFPSVTGEFDSFTVEFWIAPLSRSDWNQTILAAGSWGQFAFHTAADGGLYAGTDMAARFTPDELSAGTLSLDLWQHFSYVFDHGIGRVYKNGQLLAAKIQAYPDPWTGLHVGLPNAFTLHGRLDEMRIYNRALESGEIVAHYGAGLGQYGQPETGLVAGWHFDEGIGSTAHDYSGHDHHGALHNGVAWHEGLVQP